MKVNGVTYYKLGVRLSDLKVTVQIGGSDEVHLLPYQDLRSFFTFSEVFLFSEKGVQCFMAGSDITSVCCPNGA
jgi:hypothetical protein